MLHDPNMDINPLPKQDKKQNKKLKYMKSLMKYNQWKDILIFRGEKKNHREINIVQKSMQWHVGQWRLLDHIRDGLRIQFA